MSLRVIVRFPLEKRIPRYYVEDDVQADPSPVFSLGRLGGSHAEPKGQQSRQGTGVLPSRRLHDRGQRWLGRRSPSHAHRTGHGPQYREERGYDGFFRR